MHITADIAAKALKDTVIIVIDAVDINTVSNVICKHNHLLDIFYRKSHLINLEIGTIIRVQDKATD